MHTSCDVTAACSAAGKPVVFKWFGIRLYLLARIYVSASHPAFNQGYYPGVKANVT